MVCALKPRCGGSKAAGSFKPEALGETDEMEIGDSGFLLLEFFKINVLFEVFSEGKALNFDSLKELVHWGEYFMYMRLTIT